MDAAQNAEDGKRRRYGAEAVVPLAWESFGRIGGSGREFLWRLYSETAPEAWLAFLQDVETLIAAGGC